MAEQKLKILADAKHDASCASSGAKRSNKGKAGSAKVRLASYTPDAAAFRS